MPANLENSAIATGLERSVFIPIPKKGNAKKRSNYQTIALISHASKVMLNIHKNNNNLGIKKPWKHFSEILDLNFHPLPKTWNKSQ